MHIIIVQYNSIFEFLKVQSSYVIEIMHACHVCSNYNFADKFIISPRFPNYDVIFATNQGEVTGSIILLLRWCKIWYGMV
jgi:hypothetical protein